jgi:hypothetical protein
MLPSDPAVIDHIAGELEKLEAGGMAEWPAQAPIAAPNPRGAD